MAKIAVKFDEGFFRKAESELSRMPIAIREKALKKAIREASKVVGMRTRGAITKPGYPGDKPNLPPLSKNIKWVVRSGAKFVAGFVSSDYSKAPHFHLYEEGHEIVPQGGRVKGRHDFKRSIDETKTQQQTAIISALRKFATSKEWR